MRRRLCARAPHGSRFATEPATRAQQIAPSVHIGLHRGLPVIVACVTDSRRTAAGRLAKARLPEDRTGAEAEIFRTPMQEARHVSPLRAALCCRIVAFPPSDGGKRSLETTPSSANGHISPPRLPAGGVETRRSAAEGRNQAACAPLATEKLWP